MRKIVTCASALSLFLVLTMFITLGFVVTVGASSYYTMLSQDYLAVNSPLVILQNGTDNVSIIYMNDTSAKISINANETPSTYNYSLNIVNNNASLWEVKLEYFNYTDINCVNATIIIHNNSTSSTQIELSGGNITQYNDYYNLTSNTTIHIRVQNLVRNSSETTLLHVYLRIRIPNTTTYASYIITFEFT